MLKITTATASNASLVATILGRAFHQQAELLDVSRRDHPNYVAFETDAGVRRRIEAGAHVALATHGDEVVGTVSCACQREPAEIMRLAVLPSHRGHDYGRALMAYAEDRLAAAGAGEVEISIVAKFVRLRSYYEELGYSVTRFATVPSLPFELLYMQKPLHLRSRA